MVFVVLILVVRLVGVGFDFYHAMEKRYWIYSGGDNVYYTDDYTEENGCIYFKNHYGNRVEQCGSYRIIDNEE